MFEGMGGQGKVVGGHYINSTVYTGSKGQAAPQLDVAEQIGKLAFLRDQGALTEEEFPSKEGELLARL